MYIKSTSNTINRQSVFIIPDASNNPLKNRIDFYMAMTEKEIKSRYKHAVLGFLWIILNPLLQMVTIGLVFQYFVKTEIDNYFLFLLPGLLTWNFVSYSINKATPSIVYERSLIQKANFPREAIPLSIVFSNFFHLIISFVLLVPPILLINKTTTLTLTDIILIPLMFVWTLILTSGLSLITSCLNVRFRDIGFLSQAMILVWFYVSPIMYSLNLIPAGLRHFYQFNPLTFPLEQLRHSLLGTALPSNQLLIPNLFITIGCLIIGIIIYQKESPTFSDWL